MCYCTTGNKTPCCGEECHEFLGPNAAPCPWHVPFAGDKPMTVVKDWTLEAAEAISEQLPASAEWIASIITIHSPFKPDVAYMPVPRCETCSEWNKPEPPVLYGLCNAMSNKSFPQMCSIDEDNEFVSLPDFGCDFSCGTKHVERLRMRYCIS